VIILNAFLRHPVANTKLHDLRSHHLAAYRDERLKKVRPATINRELGLIQHALEIARREWSIPLPTNPAKDVSKPSPDKPRERRLEPGEEQALMAAIKEARNPVLGPLVCFAIETGMRRGEMLNAKWSDVNLNYGTMKIPLTKNGEPRIIPLTPEALNVLKELSTGRTKVEPALIGTKRNKLKSENIFLITQESLKKCWKMAVNRAGIDNIHFHDLRHEAISRFFEMGLSVPEVAMISGHKDVRMLFRYTHIRAADLASKIISRTRSNSV
jgi:integrase